MKTFQIISLSGLAFSAVFLFENSLFYSISEKNPDRNPGGLLLNADLSPLFSNGLRPRVSVRTAEADADSIATENFERVFNHLLVPDLASASHTAGADTFSYRGRGEFRNSNKNFFVFYNATESYASEILCILKKAKLNRQRIIKERHHPL